MRAFILLISALLIIILPSQTSALSPERPVKSIIDSLETNLKTINTYKDSLRNLNDIFDLMVARKDRTATAEKIYRAAKYNGDDSTALAMIRNLANINFADSALLSNLADRAALFRNSEDQLETSLFVDMMQVDNAITADNYTELSDQLSHLVDEYRKDTETDPYRRAELLYALCCHLRYVSRGELLGEYYGKLDSLITGMNLSTGSVRNLVYTRSAPIFTANGDHERALRTDRKLINIVDSMQTSYKRQGRKYRDLSTIKYTCLTRMLSNFPALSDSEVESYYALIKELADDNERIAADLSTTERANIFYHLAKKNDAQATAAIKRQLTKFLKPTTRNYYLNALVDIGQRTGDKNLAGMAALELIQGMREQIKSRSEERYRELQIIYDVKELAAAREELITARHKEELRNTYIAIGIIVLILVIVGAALAMMIRRTAKIRSISAALTEAVESLEAERNHLRATQAELIEARDQAKSADRLKTEFINNMSHEVQTPLSAIAEYSRLIVDCIPGDKQRYLERFADIIEVNTKLVKTLVNDVLDVAALERKQMSVEFKPASIYAICEFALDDIFEDRKSRHEGVAVVFNPEGKADATITTDGARLGQILMNLLDNAEKFTEHGTITLDFDLDREGKRVNFIITDTGIGVPRGKEESIFTRFNQLDNSTSGCGLGLYISRLIAELLGGTLRLDPDYRSGARFILSLPM